MQTVATDTLKHMQQKKLGFVLIYLLLFPF